MNRIKRRNRKATPTAVHFERPLDHDGIRPGYHLPTVPEPSRAGGGSVRVRACVRGAGGGSGAAAEFLSRRVVLRGRHGDLGSRRAKKGAAYLPLGGLLFTAVAAMLGVRSWLYFFFKERRDEKKD